MISRFFIDRPRFAGVIAIVMMLSGVIAGAGMPIANFPNVTPPQVRVSASYPGASADVIETTIAAPIEEQVNGVDGMLYMQSKSANDGTIRLDVTFDVGTDPDMAQVKVQNRVALVEPRLPEDVRRLGITVREMEPDVLLWINLFSPTDAYDALYLSNYADIHVRQPLLRVAGVGEVTVFGIGQYGMRLWLDPSRMAGLGLTAGDVIEAVREQNVQVAAGRIGEPPGNDDQSFTYTIRTRGRLQDPDEFADIIVRSNPDGSLVRVRDIARVELGAQSYGGFARLNGRPGTSVGVYLQPGGNALDAANGVAEVMRKLAPGFPPGVSYQITYDTTRFISESLNEVIETVVIAAILVIAIIYLFLGSWRATLVPMATIPVSLIGSLTVLAAFGYSLNNVTMFGLVLAIGIVVDDAIVVVENVMRRLSLGEDPRTASIRSMDEVTGPVVATVLVLLAVFVPIGALPGITGKLYREFAVAISTAVTISMINALTLSPALCAVLLHGAGENTIAPVRTFLGWVDRVRDLYGGFVVRMLRRTTVSFGAYTIVVAAGLFGYAVLPSAFLPDEDQGYFYINVQLPEGASLPRTDEVMAQAQKILSGTPGIESVIEVGGFNLVGGTNATNSGFGVVVLAPWGERPSSRELIAQVQPRLSAIRQANVIAFNPPLLRGLGRTGGLEMQVQDTRGGSPQDLAAALRAFILRANEAPELENVFSTFEADVPQIFVEVDRQKAKTLEVPLDEIFGAMQAHLGSQYVNDFNKFGRVYQVRVQADHSFRSAPEDIQQLYVRNARDEMVPLSTLVELRTALGPEMLLRHNMFRSAQVNAATAPGWSSGAAIDALGRIARETLPPGMTFDWSGATLQEIRAMGQGTILLLLGLVFVYFFLVAQYESWSLPFAVILAVPLAAVGSVVAMALRGTTEDIYSQIGLVMLVGLAAKHAILIVEFASQRHEAGASIDEAAVAGAKVRFRAVMMTSLSFVMGVLPLVVASGAGSTSRHSVGTPVFGGMIAAAIFGTLFAPLLYAVIQRGVERVGSLRRPR